MDVKAAQLTGHVAICKDVTMVAGTAAHHIRDRCNVQTLVFHVCASLRFTFVLQLYKLGKFMGGYLPCGVRVMVVAVQCAVMAEIRKNDGPRLVGVDIAARGKVFAVEI